MRSYTELCMIPDYKGRYEYLKLSGKVGRETFGFDRYLNQGFYKSAEWREARDRAIVRDMGMEMGLDGYPIKGKVIVHHMEPVTMKDIEEGSPLLVDPNHLICVSMALHNAIHYGDEELLPRDPIIRKPNDTCPWKGVIR